MKRNIILCSTVIFMVCFFTAAGLAGGEESGKSATKIANVSISAFSITWQPNVRYHKLVLTVTRPDGSVFSNTFAETSAPYYQPKSLIDGAYTYELKAIPQLPKRKRTAPGGTEAKAGYPAKEIIPRTLTQTGYFHVRDGAILTPQSGGENLSRTADILHNDDVIIDGSLCVGNDCYNGLAFGFDTIVLMENNLRIFFDDTSTIQNYPRNDWRIICNDSTDGGGRYFAIEDATEVSNILVLEAGAPDNSLYVDSHGDVGINTSTPYYELHIVDGDSPCVRLEQDSSYGWTPQKWDLCGNESNFFIRDATHASKLPFRIEPEAPTDSIFIKSNGNVGIGTGSPSYRLSVEKTGSDLYIVGNRTDGATTYFSAAGSYAAIGTATNHEIRYTTNGSTRMTLATSGRLTMAVGGGYYNQSNGDWINGSSREYKENIKDLNAKDAIDTITKLKPVTFNMKIAEEGDNQVGFIAEDVPELVAQKDRKGLSSMDIVAVLTKVVQEQQKQLKSQSKLLEQHHSVIAALKKKIAEIQQKK